MVQIDNKELYTYQELLPIACKGVTEYNKEQAKKHNSLYNTPEDYKYSPKVIGRWLRDNGWCKIRKMINGHSRYYYFDNNKKQLD